MDLVRQQKRRDCGVACVAMLAGIDYAAAWEACLPFLSNAEGATPFESFPALFSALGLNGKKTTFDADKVRSGLCEITYVRDGVEVWHYVVWDAAQKKFLDPQKEPQERFAVVQFFEVQSPLL